MTLTRPKIMRKGHSLLQLLVCSIAFTFSYGAEGSNLFSCQKLSSPGKDSAETRAQLLKSVKENLLQSSTSAELSLMEAQKCFGENASKPTCQEFRKVLLGVLKEQIQMAKIAQALTWRNVDHLHRLLLADWVHQIDMETLRAEEVANFKQQGFSYNDTEKEIALKLWKRSFLESTDALLLEQNMNANQEGCQDIRKLPVTLVSEKVRQHFAHVSAELIRINPLLAFLTEDSLNDDAQIRQAFQKLVVFNRNFSKTIRGLETEHSTSFWSYFNLALNDHEMGLTNFPRQADFVIGQLAPSEKANACASWDALEAQKTKRVNSSIGVGFSTAVVCGIGIWSGVGTIPAAALCSFAVADGLWGGYRGYDDARLSRNSAYAGRALQRDGKITPGVRNAAEAAELSSQGNVVMLINLVGILPVVKGVTSAAKGAKGELVALAKLPASDSAVSYGEAHSSTLAALMALVKASEWATTSKQSYFHQFRSIETVRQCRQIRALENKAPEGESIQSGL